VVARDERFHRGSTTCKLPGRELPHRFVRLANWQIGARNDDGLHRLIGRGTLCPLLECFYLFKVGDCANAFPCFAPGGSLSLGTKGDGVPLRIAEKADDSYAMRPAVEDSVMISAFLKCDAGLARSVRTSRNAGWPWALQ
jgi:hypothetical protein